MSFHKFVSQKCIVHCCVRAYVCHMATCIVQIISARGTENAFTQFYGYDLSYGMISRTIFHIDPLILEKFEGKIHSKKCMDGIFILDRSKYRMTHFSWLFMGDWFSGNIKFLVKRLYIFFVGTCGGDYLRYGIWEKHISCHSFWRAVWIAWYAATSTNPFWQSEHKKRG